MSKQLEEYYQSRIEELEQCEPERKGLKHTFFTVEYKSELDEHGAGYGSITTTIVSTPHEMTDEEIDAFAFEQAKHRVPMGYEGFGMQLISIRRGTIYDDHDLLNDEGDTQ